MQILPLQLFIMKHSISHSLKGRPSGIYYIHKKKVADVTKLVAKYPQSRETGMLSPSLMQYKQKLLCTVLSLNT